MVKGPFRRTLKGMTTKRGLTATILVDNNTLIDRYFLAEPALSILLEAGPVKILFDTGYSDVFLRNADRMGKSLLDLDFVALSHGHIDHTGGLIHLAQRLIEAQIGGRSPHRPDLIGHPLCFCPRPRPPLADIGIPFSAASARLHFNVRTSTEPVWITDEIVFLGEIPRRFRFENQPPDSRAIILPEGTRAPDSFLDDSALSYHSTEGLVLFTGCSHAGICNCIEYAREVCGEDRIADIIGGLHLLAPRAKRLRETLRYLKSVAPAALHACHCTSFAAKKVLSGVVPIGEVGVGLQLEYH